MDLVNPITLRDLVVLDAVKGTPGTITKGQAVYVTGYDVAKAAMKVEAALATSTSTMDAVGLAAGTITTSGGRVIVQGELADVDTSAFAVNASLYVSSSTPGALVDTPPAGPNLRQPIGVVSRSHVSEGCILVIPGARAALSDAIPSGIGTPSAGTSALASRSDHVHDHASVLSDATPSSLGVADPGASVLPSRGDHVHDHGSQGGGTLHADATTSVAGFLSSTDKTKLDASGALSNSIPAPVGVAAAGTGVSSSRDDHVHAHGDQAGGSLHALSTTLAAGFMSAADKAKLDLLSSAPLSATFWVDAGTTVPSLSQNGSLQRPFSTITAAVAAANALVATTSHIIVEVGDYSGEPQVTLLQNRAYCFDGVIKRAATTFPSFLWQASGNLTSLVAFRNAIVGNVQIVDGAGGPAASAILYFEKCETKGVQQLSGTSAIRLNASGITTTVFTVASPLGTAAATITGAVTVLAGVVLLAGVQVSSNTLTVPGLSADTCSFAGNIVVSGPICELRKSLWTQNALTVTFTTPPGTLLLDGMTDASYHNRNIVISGGGFPVLTDQIYDTSIYIPRPEDVVTGESTRTAQTLFEGSVFDVLRWVRFSQVYVRLTAQSGGATTLVVAFYQRHDRHSENPQFLIGSGSIVVSAGGAQTILVPMTGTVEVGPGPVWCLYGKVAGGGNATFRTYASTPIDFLNDPAFVPADAYPTSFTTNIGVTTTPPSTLDPRPSGGVVTPSGALNLPLVMRFSP